MTSIFTIAPGQGISEPRRLSSGPMNPAAHACRSAADREPPNIVLLIIDTMGRRENGRRTNELAANPDVAEVLAAYLESWKKRYPKVRSVFLRQAISPEETEQLKALGYLD